MRVVASMFGHTTPIITLISSIIIIYSIIIFASILVKRELVEEMLMNDKTSDENKSIQNCKLAIKTFYKEKYLTGYYFDKK